MDRMSLNHLNRLHVLGGQRRKLQEDLDRLRPELAKLIRAAAADGVRQVDIVRATGYTREYVRRLVALTAEPDRTDDADQVRTLSP